MKKINLLLLFCFFVASANLYAQTHTESFSFCDKTYSVKCDHTIDDAIEVKVNDGIKNDSEIVKYKIWTNNSEVFATNFTNNFLSKIDTSDTCLRNKRADILAFARELLKNYTTSLQNTSPVAGILKLKKNIKLRAKYYQDGKLDSSDLTVPVEISRMQAEINNGYLENIIVYLTIKLTDTTTKEVKFIAPYPIGISSIINFKKYAFTELIDLASGPVPKKRNTVDLPQFSILLDNVIDYDYNLAVERRDYSPKDTAFDIIGGTTLALHKEETKKLFEANIFTDFVGLNETKPNGLVQTEVSKRINLNTHQYLVLKSWPIYCSWGAFQYIAPYVGISKFEEHNKNLQLSNLDFLAKNPGETDISTFDKHYNRYANALDLFRYQWLSAGVDLNFLYLSNQNLKFNIYLNGGARLGFTPVIDSLTQTDTSGNISTTGLTNDYTANSLQFYPELKINFLPDERFCFSVSNKWIYYDLINPKIQMVTFDKDNPNILKPKSSFWLNTTELLMSIRVNPNSKLFGRVRLNYEIGNIKNNFAQIQVGYSTYILGNK